MYRIALILMVGIAILVITLVLELHRNAASSSLAPTIRQQLSYVAYVPGKTWTTPTKQMTYNNKILTLQSMHTNIHLTITEQATPDIFNDVPQYYPSLVAKLNQYASIGSANGTAYLTHPKELHGQQQAVLNNDGTLLFVHPSKSLSNDDWRRFFNDLQLIKP